MTAVVRDSNDSPADPPPVRVYVLVFAALVVALGAAVAVGYLVGGWVGTLLSFALAGFKAALILLYFMHVRSARRLTWVFAGASFLWLAILLAFTFTDYATRGRPARRADSLGVAKVGVGEAGSRGWKDRE